jgi:Protein of unknown function (DUF3592)
VSGRIRSTPVVAKDGAVAAIIGLGVVFLIPGILSYDWWLDPIKLRSWIATPCTIESSAVPSAPKKPGLNAITYSYSFEGRRYQSARYYFHVSPSAYHVRAHAPGQQTTCYVNPADPKEAVLVNTIPDEVSYEWFFLLLPVYGLCMIAGSVCWIVFPRITRGGPTSVADDGGAMILKPRVSPLGVAAIYGLISVGFNGLVAPMAFLFVSSLRSRDWSWSDASFIVIFVVPFSSLGLISMFVFGKKVLAVFNPQPTLKLTPGQIPLGGTARLSWQFKGRTRSLCSVEILLSGTEQATKVVPRDSYTYSHVFYRRVLFQRSAADGMSAGDITFVVPADSMHSFDSTNNSIAWSIEVCAEAARLPDVAIAFPFAVTPHEQAVT